METKDIILELRTKKGLSQDELAEKIFVTRQAVSRWENGETTPNTETLKLLSKLFDVSINTLLGSPRQLICQCCGMPLEDGNISKEKDGIFNEDYCKWCYADGEYMYHDIRALSDGTQQLSITMESDIEFLTTGQYNKLRGKKAETIQSRMDSINKAFSFIHQATLARAAIYCEQDEYLAMANVLDEYSRFIEGTVVENANLLSQCDPTDNGTENGLWHSRAALKLDASELRKTLSSGSEEFYLSIEDGSNEG